MLDLPCPVCKGARVIGTALCPYCEGSGRDPGNELFRMYALDVSLLANQNLSNQRIVIDGGAHFRWKALTGSSTGRYSLRIRTNDGRYMMSSGADAQNDLVFDENFVGTRENPAPIHPAPLYAPNGQILVDLFDRSGAPNVLQLCFWGADVFPSAS